MTQSLLVSDSWCLLVHAETLENRGILYAAPASIRIPGAMLQAPASSEESEGAPTAPAPPMVSRTRSSDGRGQRLPNARRPATQITLQGGPSGRESFPSESGAKEDDALTAVERVGVLVFYGVWVLHLWIFPCNVMLQYKIYKFSQPMDKNRKRVFLGAIGKRSRSSYRNAVTMKLEEDFSSIYVLHSPAMFFRYAYCMCVTCQSLSE